MKKIIIIILVLLLFSCAKENKIQLKEKKVITIEESINELNNEMFVEKENNFNLLDEEIIKLLIKESSEITNVIEIIILHDLISEKIDSEYDSNLSLELQKNLIEKVVIEEIYLWRIEVVKGVIESRGLVIMESDFDIIVEKTIVNDAIDIMIDYETIYYKRRVK